MKHRDYMQQAFLLAQKALELGEVPVGAVIVHNGQIIAKAHNLRQTDQNAAAHAELLAIEQACKKLNSWRLEDCVLYVTLEPCLMCTGAIINSRLKRVVFACVDEKAGGMGGMTDLLQLPVNHKPDVIIGVMEQECTTLLQQFFQNLRRKRLEK